MAATASGELRSRIRFERATVVRGALGAKAPASWELLGHDRSKVRFGSGSERAQAGVEGASQTATFRVRANSLTRSVTVRDRIVFADMNWDVVAVAPLLTNPAEIEFTGVATRG